MTTDLLLVNAVVGILLPALVALVAKATAPAQVKALINLALSVVAGVLTPLATTDHVNWQAAGLSFAQVFVVAIATHYGLLKPTGVTGATGVIATAVRGGVGPAAPAPVVVPSVQPAVGNATAADVTVEGGPTKTV